MPDGSRELFETATWAHLGGTVVLALFFVLLERHDSRPYLRHWMAAWIAQALALAVWLFTASADPQVAFTLYLFLETAHGILLWLAALSYSRGTYRRRPLAVLIPVALWAGVGPLVFGDAGALVAAQSFVLAATALAALVVQWPLREPTAMGMRLVTNMLGLLALFYLLQANVFSWSARGGRPVLPIFEAAPFGVLLLQVMLALGMVLVVMEANQFALTTTNAQLREAEHKLKVLAETDPLTGCFNRRVFRDLVDDLRARAADAHGLVVLVDMDGLKAINDRRGHSAGDLAIRELAEAIRTRTRATDLVVRWGGDEFVIVMPGVHVGDAEARRREIVDGVAAAGLSASAGCAVYGEGVDIMSAVDHADREMYSVKEARRAQARA